MCPVARPVLQTVTHSREIKSLAGTQAERPSEGDSPLLWVASSHYRIWNLLRSETEWGGFLSRCFQQKRNGVASFSSSTHTHTHISRCEEWTAAISIELFGDYYLFFPTKLWLNTLHVSILAIISPGVGSFHPCVCVSVFVPQRSQMGTRPGSSCCTFLPALFSHSLPSKPPTTTPFTLTPSKR